MFGNKFLKKINKIIFNKTKYIILELITVRTPEPIQPIKLLFI